MLLVEGERLLGPVELDPEPVLAARGDLADDDRADRARVGLELDEGGVLGRDGRSSPRPLLSRTRDPASLTRSGTAVSSRAETRSMRWPETNSARSHQCEPMSANAREAPPSCSSTRQLASSGAQQPVLEVRAVQQAQRARSARPRRARAPRAPSGSSGRRTARRPELPTRPRRRRVAAPRRRRARAASRRSRACPRPARPRRAERGGGSACRRARRRRPDRRPAPRPSEGRSAPSSAAAA